VVGDAFGCHGRIAPTASAGVTGNDLHEYNVYRATRMGVSAIPLEREAETAVWAPLIGLTTTSPGQMAAPIARRRHLARND
jgi:hypothetical protein